MLILSNDRAGCGSFFVCCTTGTVDQIRAENEMDGRRDGGTDGWRDGWRERSKWEGEE